MEPMQEQLLEELVARTNNALQDVTVRIDAEHVVIGGRAPSYYVKQIATQTAIASAGNRRVRNEMSVGEEVSGSADSAVSPDAGTAEELV